MTIVAACAFIVFAAALTSQLKPTEAAPVAGSITIQAKLDYSLTLSLGDAGPDNCTSKANGGAQVNLSPTPNGSTYFACLNALVNTDNPNGYSLSIQGIAQTGPYLNLASGTSNILPNTTNSTATAIANDRWGICIPSTYATGSAITGFSASCGAAADGSTTTAYNYAGVPTAPTLIKKITALPTTSEQRNTPIRIGIRPTAAIPIGSYTGTIVVSASINGAGGAYTPLMQTFSATDCNNLSIGATTTLFDARDNKPYRVKKMPDNKCWMLDNLAYTGGGVNTYSDAVPMGTSGATGQLNLHTSGIGVSTTTLAQSSVWDRGNFNRWMAVNTNQQINVADGTRCSNSTATGDAPMDSICGSQVLYNFCAAAGLDNSTTPTCAAVSNTTTGTGMTSTGVVGLAGGRGGESKGDTGANAGSICPKTWRIPQGRNNASGTNDTANEWAILNGSMNAGTLAAASTDNDFYQYWQPNATTGGNNANMRSFFGTVAAGLFLPGSGLYNQSTNGSWWASTLDSGTNAYRTYVYSTGVSLGTSNSSKFFGASVRCVFP